MLDKDHFMSLNILKKEVYTGSMKGMRYRLEKIGDKPEEKILVHIWPEPYCFDKTDEDKKIKKDFPFNEDGKSAIVDWLNEVYAEQGELFLCI